MNWPEALNLLTIAGSAATVGAFLWRVVFMLGRIAKEMEHRDFLLRDHENRLRVIEGKPPLPVLVETGEG